VATVESRAFGAARADAEALAGLSDAAAGAAASAAVGSAAQLTGLVPVLDLANHTPRPCFQHRVDPSTATFALFRDTAVPGTGAAAAPAAGSHDSSIAAGTDAQDVVISRPVQQLLITYGSKDNR